MAGKNRLSTQLKGPTYNYRCQVEVDVHCVYGEQAERGRRGDVTLVTAPGR
jgi:hypothetical protein